MTPEILYHHTDPQARASIRRHRLLTSRDQTGLGAVFLTDSPRPDDAGTDVGAVQVSGLTSIEGDFTGNDTDEEWFAAYRPIHRSRLRLIHAGRRRAIHGHLRCPRDDVPGDDGFWTPGGTR